jgi:hypothetical protein
MYCWDRGSKKIAEIKMELISLTPCPEDVLADFMLAVENSAKKH